MKRSRLAALIRAAADRREGLARLTGQGQFAAQPWRSSSSWRSAGSSAAQRHAAERAEQASGAFTALETKVAGLDAGEFGLDADHESAVKVLDEIETAGRAASSRNRSRPTSGRPGSTSRCAPRGPDLQRRNLGLACRHRPADGLLGSIAALIKVQSPYETAIAAAFGAAADAVAVTDLDAAMDTFDHLKAEDLGKAGLLLGGVVETERTAEWLVLPRGARYAVGLVEVPDQLTAAVQRALRKVGGREPVRSSESDLAPARCRCGHP